MRRQTLHRSTTTQWRSLRVSLLPSRSKMLPQIARQIVRRGARSRVPIGRLLLPGFSQIDRSFSSASERPTSLYAVVDHSAAYEEAMQGMHGKQLQLAQLEGYGRDHEDFDPFLEEELEEEDGSLEAEEDDDSIEYEEEQDLGEAEQEPWPYNNDGSLKWKKSQLATFRAGAPAGGMFAIVELAGSQHKVTTDDVMVVNRLQPVDVYKVGSVHTLKDVMLVGSSHLTLVGMPYVTGAEVDVLVEEITQDAKVVVFKKRRRKNYKRKKGHRRDVTILRILDVRPPTEFANHTHAQRENP